jgi:hypothetical protein
LTKIGCATRLVGDGSVRKSLSEGARTVGTTIIAPQDLGQLNVLAMARGMTGALFDQQSTAACDGSVAIADDAPLQQTLNGVTSELLAALQFGAGNESLQRLPAVQFDPNAGRAGDLLYELADVLVSGLTSPTGADLAVGGSTGLCELVQSSTSNPRRAKSLCKVLTNVDKAVARGKTATRDKLLASFRAKVGKEAGVSMSADDAAMVSDLSFFLLEDEGVFF